MATKITSSTIKNNAGEDIKVMQLTGDQAVRVNFTNLASQLKGVDLNNNGVINNNGKENSPAFLKGQGYVASGYQIFDAYPRDLVNTSVVKTNDSSPNLDKNFIADVYYNGTGVDGDGVSTNGNIYLGGLGVDVAYGGIGNDFMTGGGVASDRFADGVDALYGKDVTNGKVADVLSGGRNADFFFADLSAIDATDGKGTSFDGGNTTDDSAAGLVQSSSGVNSQNNDWILLEANDDNEPTQIQLGNGFIITRSGDSVAQLKDVESLDASGKLYGFINNIDVKLGQRATDARTMDATFVPAAENYSFGSTSQLDVTGSDAANVVIGSYDNDIINGNPGDDILMGGNLGYLLANKNNPNLLNNAGGLSLNPTKVTDINGVKYTLVNDGIDSLIGGVGKDNIVFEMDGGKVDGSAVEPGLNANGDLIPAVLPTASGDTAKNVGDTLWLTDFTMGRVRGATVAGEATAQTNALTKLTQDSVVRVDLGNDGTSSFKNYGGTNASTQDQTNYNTGAKAVTMTGMDSIIATGLGAVDFKAAGNNSPDLAFDNQQNYKGIGSDTQHINLDLRGSNFDNTLYANTGNDVIEGRQGDDNLSGGKNSVLPNGKMGGDKFYFAFNDGVDVIHRQKDVVDNKTGLAGSDNLWDNYDPMTGVGSFTQDFRPFIETKPGTSQLTLNFVTDWTKDINVSGLRIAYDLPAEGQPGTGLSLDPNKLYDAQQVVHADGSTGFQSLADFAKFVNDEFSASTNGRITAQAIGLRTLVITDNSGKIMSDNKLGDTGTAAPKEGYVFSVDISNTTVGVNAKFSNSAISDIVEDDLVIFKDYVSRPANLGRDFNTASKIAGTNDNTDVQASRLVTAFLTNPDDSSKIDTHLAQNQNVLVRVTDAHVGDVVTVTVNGVAFSYTAKEGETSQQVVDGLINVINNYADSNTTAGKLQATGVVGDANNYPTLTNNVESSAQFSIQQVNVGGSMTYMNVSVAQPVGTGAKVDMHDQSENNINLYMFDGRNGRMDQNSIRFVGKDDTTLSSTLKTAVDTGDKALNGTDANAKGLNGDDLLLGGNGNDTINGGSGDDRILMSKGSDTVNAGGNVMVGTTLVTYQDTLQAEESTFGAGTKFTVVLQPQTGTGTIQALDAAGVTHATNFNDIEVVRVLENSRNTELNLRNLKDAAGNDYAVAANVFDQTDVIYNAKPGATPLNPSDAELMVAGTVYNGNATTTVYGAESLFTGDGNDVVAVDEHQVAANNVFGLGGEFHPTGELLKVFDTLTYQGVVDPVAQTQVTLKVGIDAVTDQVVMAGGVLGANTSTDTLDNVERVNFAPEAVENYTDVLDVSAVTGGAVVNFGDANVRIGSSLTPALDVGVSTIANDGIQLDAGAVSAVATPAAELINVGGIAGFETVMGSAGDDRVIVGGGLQASVLSGVPGVPNPFDGYTWNLGAGANDTVDYRAETTDLSVLVSTNDAVADKVTVVGGVDTAIGVETYIGGTANNLIDLSAATVNTTIKFQVATGIADPNGSAVTFVKHQVVDSATPTTVYASFLNQTGAANWGVKGGAKDETMVLTNNDWATGHTFALAGGNNTVDYSADTLGAITLAPATVLGAPGFSVTKAGGGIDLLSAVGGSLNILAPTSSTVDTVNMSAVVAGDRVAVDLVAGTVSEINATTGVEVRKATIVNFENVTGSAGNDTLTGNASNNAIDGGLGNDSIIGNGGSDTLTGGLGNDTVVGSSAAEIIYGDDAAGTNPLGGNDSIIGSGGADSIFGGFGNDTIIGGSVAETINGGDGNDQITGAGGIDILTGGNGVDQFIYGTADADTVVGGAAEQITDFVSGTDKIVIAVNDAADMLHTVPTGANSYISTAAGVTTVVMELGTDGAFGNTVPDVLGMANTYTDNDQSIKLQTPGIVGTDITLKIQQTTGLGQTQDLGISGATAEVMYTDKLQSISGSVDTFANFDFGAVGVADKLNLSSLGLAAMMKDYDIGTGVGQSVLGNGLQTDEIMRVETKPTLDSTLSGPNNGFAPDATQNPALFAAYVATTNHAAAPTNGTVMFVLEELDLTPGAYRLFVDSTHDGVWNPANDTVIDFTGEISSTVASVPAILGVIGTQVTADPTTPATPVDSFLVI